MQNKALEIFYLLFQGVLTFQVLIFAILFFITRRKELLYYSLFLLLAASYFFINAPFTFFGIPEETVWNSVWYEYVNTPLIIIENLFYLLFLQSFYADITPDKKVTGVIKFTLKLIPILAVLFLILNIAEINNQFIFYTVKLIAVIPAVVIIFVIYKRRPPFAILVANGLLCSILGTCITVLMIILRNQGVHHLFTHGYPLFFIRLGLLGEIIFYMTAMLHKWQFQEKQLVVEKLESQLAVEKLRARISGELHDDFGSTLSGVSMYGHMINDLLHSGKYEEVKQSVKIVQQSVDEMTHRLSDLVWSINPERDTLVKLLEKLEEFATDIAMTRNMQVVMNIPGNIQDLTLPVDTRRNIYLIFKEGINNAVKYSDASKLKLNVSSSEGVLSFYLSDNGKSFNTSEVKKGNGLNNMQKRASQIGAEFDVRAKPGIGTTIFVQFKIT